MALKVNRTYGAIEYGTKAHKNRPNDPHKNVWTIVRCEPHVSIKIKSIFKHIPAYGIPPYEFDHNPQSCFDLLWFIDRYPLEISKQNLLKLQKGRADRIRDINEIEAIMMPDYISNITFKLRHGEKARHYQESGAEAFMKLGRLLLADDIGLGKTLTATLSFLSEGSRPAAVVAQAHLPIQWKNEIERFTELKVHLVATNQAHELPPADVYIFKYTSTSGWTNIFESGVFKTVVFDECQELRRTESDKYHACRILSTNASRCLGLSASPIYNYGGEIFNVLDCINPGCLGDFVSFLREWTSGGKKVIDPHALGAFLKESLLILQRKRADVGRELPPINKIIYTIDYDEDVMDADLDLAKKLAITVLNGSFIERGEASRELNALVRHATGVAKAKSIAQYVKMIADGGEPVVVALWHRDVYDILLEELKEYNPVMYTGSESALQKQKSKKAFIDGESKVFLLSLRSGIGLDGLQYVSKIVVYGELDYSGKVMDQVAGRLDRDRGELEAQQVTAIYLVANGGSDPIVVDIVGLKNSQSHGIMNPGMEMLEQYSEESAIKKLAEAYLKKINK